MNRILDIGSQNPRMQCFECGRWMRLHGKRLHGKRLEVVNGEPIVVAVQRFYSGCEATGNDHPCGSDVCSKCCPEKCKQRLAVASQDGGAVT